VSQEYAIPADEKERVFQLLYPFRDPPTLDETWFDVRRRKEFCVRDFKVVREDGVNLLVSPYYFESGATVLEWEPMEYWDPAKKYADDDDWIDPDEDEEDADEELDDLEIDDQREVRPVYCPTLKPGAEDIYFGLMDRYTRGPRE
jgi:hypothetical protein